MATTVSRRATANASPVTATSIAVPHPTNVVGDILLMSVATSGTPSAVPTGWTLVGSATTNTAAKVYVYWRTVTAVLSGSVTVSMTASSTLRATMSSYTGDTSGAAPASVTNSSTSSGTAITAPSQTYGNGFVYWANGRTASSTLSGQTSSAGTWTATEAYENAGTNSITVTDGPIDSGTTSTLSATSSASVGWNSVVLSLGAAGGGPVAPTVDAGADATGTVGATFTRTATENDNGSAITARAWTIASGPTGAGTTIGTAAALSITPSAAGTYVLRYSATNSGGTATDDVTLTVSGAGSTAFVRTFTTAAHTEGAATPLSVAKPTGLADGDMLLALITHGGGSADQTTEMVTRPAGFNVAAPFATNAGGSIFSYYKVVTSAAAEPSTYEFAPAIDNDAAVHLLAIGGAAALVDTDSVAGASRTAGLTLSVDAVNNSLAIVFVGVDDSANNAFGVPSEMTTVVADSLTTTILNSAVYSQAVPTAATLSKTVTYTGTATNAFPNGHAFVFTTGTAAAAPTLVHRVVGVPTGTSASLAVRTTSASSVRAQVSTSSTFASGIISSTAGTPNAQGDTQLTVTGLTAGASYYHRIGMTDSGGTETFSAISVKPFKTAPSGQYSFAFDFSSCCDAADSAAMAAIAGRNDDLFFHLGDLYYDDGAATTLQSFRSHMVAKIEAANHVAVFGTTPTVYTPSDHDGMANNTTAGVNATAWTNWNAAYRELFPQDTLPDTTGVYQTFTWGRVRFIKLDTRSFKSTPSATDDSSKTALGATQKQWLKDTITAATEPVIVIINADPWIGVAEAGDDAWLGYTTERTELASFFAASGKNIAMLGGDMHALAADDGTNAPGGIAVFQASPLYNSASIKGGPYSASTYPTTAGAVVQQYGRVVVTDTGSAISLAFTGYSSDNTQRVALTKTYNLARSGTATGSWAFSGSATGKGTPKGSATGSWSFAGSATGKRTAKGAAAGSWTFVGAATGKTTPRGTAGGSWTFAGSASGSRTPKATAAGGWTFSGTAAGRRQPKATATGTFTYIGAAAGVSPVVGAKQGNGAGTWTFSGAAAGNRSPKSAASGTWAFVGTAIGRRLAKSTAAGSWGYASTAIGQAPQPDTPAEHLPHLPGTAVILANAGTATLLSVAGTAALRASPPGTAALASNGTSTATLQTT